MRMVVFTSSTDNITLKIDPAVVLATRKSGDDKVLELKLYVDGQMTKHIAAADPNTQYAPKESTTLTGSPKAPTTAAVTNTTQIASTAFCTGGGDSAQQCAGPESVAGKSGSDRNVKGPNSSANGK